MNNRLNRNCLIFPFRITCALVTLLMPGIRGLGNGTGPGPLGFRSPDGHFLVRLYRAKGPSVGNCAYDRADLIEITSQKILAEFGGGDSGEGLESDSVVWSPRSTRVAVYTHDARTGTVKVIQMAKSGITESTIPDYTLPDEGKPENSGRELQRWSKPVRWLSENTLLLSDTETIEQERGVQAYLNFTYDIQIVFDGEGVGTVKAVKEVKYARDKAWLK